MKLFRAYTKLSMIICASFSLLGCGSGIIDRTNDVTGDENAVAQGALIQDGNTSEGNNHTILKEDHIVTGNSKIFPWDHGELEVSQDKHFLQHADGTAFFWMADTAWKLVQKTDKSDINQYLIDRKKKGFTVILVTVAEHAAVENKKISENAFHNYSWREPNEAYWKHVDYMIEKAEEIGLYIGLLPAWHMYFDKNESKDLIKVEDAEHYGKYVANRYKKKKNIVWIVGGDSKAEDPRVQNIWSKLGSTLYDIVGDSQLIAYHPAGAVSSSTWFHNENWLAFNMLQSGHCAPVQRGIATLRKDYEKKPFKPTLDGEPRYETIEECFYKEINSSAPKGIGQRTGHRFDDADVREIAYKQIFSGAFGHTYGHHSIRQMSEGKKEKPQGGIDATVNSWQDALGAEGARQMGYIVKLMKSRDILSRVPDNTIVEDYKKKNIVATRGEGYAFIYLPKDTTVTVKFNTIAKDKVRVSWFNPRTGKMKEIETVESSMQKEYMTDGEDMILIVDDVDKNYVLLL